MTIVAIAGASWAQYYAVKWTCDSCSLANIGISGALQSPIPNYNNYDLENDGVSELVTNCQRNISSDYSLNRYEIRDSRTYALKYEIKAGYLFDNDTMFIRTFFGFYDVDADGAREMVAHAQKPDNTTVIVFLNVFAQQIEYSTQNDENLMSPFFSDIDNDGYPEILRPNYILGHSATPVSQPNSLPKKTFAGAQVLSNPAIGSALIDYYVPSASFVKISIFDPSGKSIRTLANGHKKAGNFLEIWDGKSDDGKGLAPGQYYYNIQIGEFLTNKKAILLR
jgi:hypothetical protein